MFYLDTELVEETRKLCDDDLISAKLREQLLAIELDAHRQGWDSAGADPYIFQLDMHPDTCDTDVTGCDGYNETLRSCVERLKGDTGRALQFIARHAENTTQLLRTGVPPEEWAERVPDEVMDDLKQLREHSYPMLAEAGMAGEDLVGADKEGNEFVGYGLRSEVWAAYARPDQADEARRYAYAGKLYEYPERQEFRYVWFITRTGETWIVERRRSHVPIVVRLHPRESGHHYMSGNIFNALGRLVNAVVAEDVPVWNRKAVPVPRASGPNPLIRPQS